MNCKEKDGFPWEVLNSSCSSQNLEAWTHPTLQASTWSACISFRTAGAINPSFIKEPVFKPHLRLLLGVSKFPKNIISPKWPHSIKRQSLSKSHRNSRQQTERLKPRGRNFKRQLSRSVGDWQRESRTQMRVKQTGNKLISCKCSSV